MKNFESIIRPEDIQRVRETIKDRIQEIQESGKLIESGVFADDRGAFLLLDVESASELTKMLFPIHDMARIETHPIYSFEELGELFKDDESL
jgi:hypothetical protein